MTCKQLSDFIKGSNVYALSSWYSVIESTAKVDIKDQQGYMIVYVAVKCLSHTNKTWLLDFGNDTCHLTGDEWICSRVRN